MRRSRAVRSSEATAGSEGVGPGLPGPDPPDVLDGHDPYLAVADLAGASRFEELLDHPVDIAIVDEDLDPDLGNEVDRVLGAPVHLGVPALAAETLDVGDGETLHTEVLDGVLHVVDLERLDDAHDELHESWILPCGRGRSHALERVTGLRVLGEVEPGVLVLLRYPDPSGEDLAEHEHDAERHEERPHQCRNDREHLLAEQAEPTAEEHAVSAGGVDRRVGEEAE